MAAGANSFGRQSRLLKPADFKYVFDHAVVSSDRLFRVFARAGTTPQTRLGMAVSLKVDQRANVRNRIKRVIRESFRHRYPVGGEDAGGDVNQHGRDYVVVAAPPSAEAANSQIRNSLSKHWQTLDQKLGNDASKRAQRQKGQQENV